MNYFFKVLTTPSCWIQLYTYNEGFDQRLKAAIRSHKFVNINEYTADFAAREGLPVIRDNCPACFRMPTKRQHIKMLLAAQEKENRLIFDSLLSTMRPLMAENNNNRRIYP